MLQSAIKLDSWHWYVYSKFIATEPNWLISFLMMAVIVQVHGIILWVQPNNIGSS